MSTDRLWGSERLIFFLWFSFGQHRHHWRSMSLWVHTHAHKDTHTHNHILSWYINVLFTACIFGCDFDTSGDLCGWTTQTEDPNVFGFSQWAGETDTEGTGPDNDFSKPGCKWFFFVRSKWKWMFYQDWLYFPLAIFAKHRTLLSGLIKH